METPLIDQINAMSDQDRAAMHRRHSRKLARNILGMIFIKAATPRLLGVLARGLTHNMK